MPPAPAAPRRVLPVLVLAQLAGTSPWFAVNAVMPDLQRQYAWDAAAIGTLTSALQLGFIAGTLVFALLAVADRWPARWVFLLCTWAAAGCTLAAAASASSYAALVGWRGLTGFFLAGIYPVGMKIAAQWFPRGLGAALGWLVGALVLGSASPHALRALGAQWHWSSVFFSVAALAALAGVLLTLAVPEPPHADPPARSAMQSAARADGKAGAQPNAQPDPQPSGLHLGALGSLWRDGRMRASVGGYCGHMVELYTMWVLVPALLATRLADAVSVSWWSFAVLGVGAFGCVGGGLTALRVGSARVAAVLLAGSGLCCLLAPWALSAPLPLFLLWMLVWGVTVAGDSPQLSAITAANAPRAAVGSVLTLTTSLGFAISALSIEVFVRLAQVLPLARVLPWLALGPLLGLLALRPLLRSPRTP